MNIFRGLRCRQRTGQRTAALLLGVTLGATGAVSAEPRVEAITLSSGGLALFQRAVPLSGSGEVHLEVPLEQVDDILKSLVVRDPAGRLVGMRLDGLTAVEETFRRLPFDPAEMGSLPRLAATLQGVPVRATSAGRSVEGMLLGVDESEAADQESLHTLSVLDDEGVVTTLRLDSDARLEILDAALRERLRQAAEVSGRGRTDEMRRIVIELAGEGERDVGLDYVVAAPVWKTAYRLLLDDGAQARLQAWAVIENASGSDWEQVGVTLSSGAPVTLTQRLLERYWPQRSEVPVTADSIAPVRPDEGAIMLDRQRFQAVPAAAAPSGAAADGVDAIARPAQQGVASQGDTAATWRLPDPVDLEAGRTLSVPYVDTELPAERLALFQPERDERHPVAAVRLENTTDAWLPPGLVTVYAAEGHVGDVSLPGIPAGESRLASFAADRQVRVTSEATPEERLERVTLVDGALRATRLSRVTTRYTVQSDAQRQRDVLVEHPLRAGWQFDSEALVESTPTHRRLRVSLAPGESEILEAREERTRSETVALVDTDTELLVQWSDAADPATAEAMTTLVEHRREVAEVEAELSELARGVERAVEHQARIRENLTAVGLDSEPGQRYLADLDAQETRIADLEGQREETQERLAARRDALAAFIREL